MNYISRIFTKIGRALLCGLGLTAACNATDPVVIRLSPIASVESRDVRMGDVATIAIERHMPKHTMVHQVAPKADPSQTNVEMINNIRDLDLTSIRGQDQMALLDKSLIDVRLQLFGLSPQDFRLLGPEQIIVSLGEIKALRPNSSPFTLVSNSSESQTGDKAKPTYQLNDLYIEQTIQSSLSRQFRMRPDDVQVQLLRPIVDGRLRSRKLSMEPRVEVVAPSSFPYGRTSLTVRIWDGTQLILSRSAFVEARVQQRVLVARKMLPHSQPIDAQSVSPEYHFVSVRHDELDVSDTVGRVTKRTIRPGEILSLDDLRSRPEQQQILIRSRDSVRIVAYRKGMKFVVPAAEALQSGRKGQLIRVRNLQSKKTIVGKVIDQGEVEVLFNSFTRK